MRLTRSVLVLIAVSCAAPAFAAHLDNLETPYPSRGACESAVAQFNGDVRPGLLDQFPMFFDRNGDVASFLTRAFPCEYDETVDAWFITDHRGEVLFSDWYQHKP